MPVGGVVDVLHAGEIVGVIREAFAWSLLKGLQVAQDGCGAGLGMLAGYGRGGFVGFAAGGVVRGVVGGRWGWREVESGFGGAVLS